ncbi:hypothetical protein ACPOL_7085 (plasmid) [Acidisarcina polymorpha]|uniref:Uncharacterized protein n=1 Tax=Acidisarcina polymorpha TaxID=2211140 RepID=A0A2Z5GBW8_9BACT|nr:hypothetical protein ACPOL_7085 [Acidisarcina polymorpha]
MKYDNPERGDTTQTVKHHTMGFLPNRWFYLPHGFIALSYDSKQHLLLD